MSSLISIRNILKSNIFRCPHATLSSPSLSDLFSIMGHTLSSVPCFDHFQNPLANPPLLKIHLYPTAQPTAAFPLLLHLICHCPHSFCACSGLLPQLFIQPGSSAAEFCRRRASAAPRFVKRPSALFVSEAATLTLGFLNGRWGLVKQAGRCLFKKPFLINKSPRF